MNANRRKFLIGASAIAGTASLVGYKQTLHAALTFKHYGEHTKDAIYTNSLTPEISLKDNFVKNEDFSLMNSMCNGCTTQCGVRVKLDNKTQQVVRIFGNPYNPLSTDPWLEYDTPLKQSFTYMVQNQDARSTVCARGNIIFDKEKDPFRVLKPLKRVGKRGEDKWQEISTKQLIDEIVNGGNLFGEGEVEGLKSIQDTKNPIDINDPLKGPKSNGLCIIGTNDNGRKAFMQERFQKSFGTKNYQGHTATCGLSMRAGEAAYLSDFKKYPHLKPDFENTTYLLTFGTAPAQAGNPFKRQAKLLVRSRVKKNAKCVAVAPMLMNSDSISVGDKSEWLPIIPGEDLALASALLQVIINEKLYNESYLKIPSQISMKKLNDASFTNSTHLIIQEGELKGSFLQKDKVALVVDENGNLASSNDVLQGRLHVDEVVKLGEVSYKVKSSFTMLSEAINEKSLEFLSQRCGVSVQRIQEVAREFASHGRSASVDCHGGTMHTTGFYTTYAIMMLGAMVGNLNYKGGMSKGGGKYKDVNGAVYNLAAYKGKFKPQGYRIDKTRVKYEKTKEFAKLKSEGKNPYPAFDTFYPFVNALETEIFTNSAKKYPYQLKAVISWNANFIYGQCGGHHIQKLLLDPQKSVPLLIAIDPFINESSKFADYIVPDSLIYDSWASTGAWAGTQTKLNVISYPIKQQKQATFENGEPICMDSFIIELGKALKLPGFGKNAIKANDGTWHDLDKPSDFYLRVFENIAMDQTPVLDISDEEIALANLQPYVSELKKTCKQNWRKTAYVMARGGRYENKQNSYIDDKLKYPIHNVISVYNEVLAKTKNSLTGKNFSGVVRYFPPQQSDGTTLESLYPKEQYPLLAFSYKSNVLSQAVASSDGISRIRYTTYLDLNPTTAKKFNLFHGDFAKVNSAFGEVIGMVRYRHGIHPQSLGIEHGLGRDGEGAVDISINGNVVKGKINRRSGVNINKLGLLDTSRELATLGDFVCGSNTRQAIPIKIQKL